MVRLGAAAGVFRRAIWLCAGAGLAGAKYHRRCERRVAAELLEGSRPDIFGGGYKGDQSYEVWLDTTLLGTFSTASGQDFTLRTLTGPGVTAGNSYNLIFHGLSASDNTAFLDDVSASVSASGAVPEPATWAMLITGFGLVGAAMRRRGLATA